MQIVKVGATDVTVTIRIIDSGDGTPETGVTSASGGLDLWYRNGATAAKTSITEADLSALTDAHSDGGMLHIDDGYYRLDLPDAAVPAVGAVTVVGGGVTGMIVLGTAIQAAPAANVTHWLDTAAATPTVAGVPEVDMTHLNGGATSGNNATLHLAKLNIVNSGGSAIVAQSSGSNGHGLELIGNGSGEGLSATGGATGHGAGFVGGATSGAGINATAPTSGDGIDALGGGSGVGLRATGGSTNGHGAAMSGGNTNGSGLVLTGVGSGHGLVSSGNTTGHGIWARGGATSGDGINATAQTSGDGIDASGAGGGVGLRLAGQGAGAGLIATGGATGHGAAFVGGGTSGDGINATGGGAGDGIDAIGTGGGVDLRADITGDITGTVSGNATSTQATNIETDTQDIQSRLPAALSSGNIKADILAINASTTAAARLALTAARMLPGTVDNTAFTATTTILESDDITEATADHFNGRIIIFTSGALEYQATTITDYALNGGRGRFTYTAITEAPADNGTFIII